MKTLIALHCDTCLPSYWGGHHLPHIQVIVQKGDTLGELKANLLSELNQGAVMGSDAPAEDDTEWYNAARRAVEKIEAAGQTALNPDDTRLFLDLEETSEDDDGSESVYAYFVFEEGEDLVDMTLSEYVAVQGLQCPFCRSESITGQEVVIDNGAAYQEVVCADCDKSWTDTYTLDGYIVEE